MTSSATYFCSLFPLSRKRVSKTVGLLRKFQNVFPRTPELVSLLNYVPRVPHVSSRLTYFRALSTFAPYVPYLRALSLRLTCVIYGP